MNFTTLAASCALLCALPFPLLSLNATTPAALQTADNEATVVIRYDPAAIFLTNDLVSPLCEREVKLSHKSHDGIVGQLFMNALESNRLQPKGVFVGRVLAEWKTDVTLSAEQRKETIDDGLEQLRTSLARRLVHSRRDQLQRRVAVLEDMANQLRKSTDERTRQLAQADELALIQRELDQLADMRHGRELEVRAAQQNLLMSTAQVKEIEAQISQAATAVDKIAQELSRTRKLTKEGLKSELDLQVAENRLHAAESVLVAEQAQLDNQRLQVEQRGNLVAVSERGLEDLHTRISILLTQEEALESRLPHDSPAELEITLSTDRNQLNELSAELQRARADLATIIDVTVERW